jgi:hypothetical protein
MPAITTSNKVLVDIPFITPITGKEKIIFSSNGKTSLWFDFKKIFWQKRMEEAAAMRIKNIFDEYSKIDINFNNTIQNIKAKDGIDETLVIDTFAEIERKKD